MSVPDPNRFNTEADRFMLLCSVIADCDLDFILRTVDGAHSVGSLIDPTSYRAALARGDLGRLEELARLAQPLRTAARRVIEEIKAGPRRWAFDAFSQDATDRDWHRHRSGAETREHGHPMGNVLHDHSDEEILT